MKLTENFTLEEFLCKCPRCKGKTPSKAIVANITALAKEIQKVRNEIKKPIIVLSGVRCPQHNKEVGGVPGSVHLTGSAGDLRIGGMTSKQMFELMSGLRSSEAKKGTKPVLNFTGVGFYPTQNFVHVDLGKTKPRPNTWEL